MGLSPRTKALLDGVLDLYPGADRQALQCLAELLDKDVSALEREIARLQDIVGQEPQTAYLEAVQRSADEYLGALKHEKRAADRVRLNENRHV